MIVAGDIGGTKTHLVLFNASDPVHWIKEKKYSSREYKNLTEILQDFLSTSDRKVETMCLGIAGPVINNRCQATNLPWVIDAKEISKELKIPKVDLINDLEANAYGIRALSNEEIVVLNPGNEKAGNKALIAAGTGLGEAGLYWDGKSHRPFACEGGHCDFAPTNEREIGLLRYLKKKYDHVSFERILSGSGFYLLYRFFIEAEGERPDASVEEIVKEGKDPAKIISERGLKKESAICSKVIDLFVSIYGAEAGNLALKMLSVAGMYIGGGIAPKIIDALKTGVFMKAFKDKGRFSSLLSSIPVKVILNENTALLGAARYAKGEAR